MLNQEERKQLLNELNQKRNEVSELKKRLNQLNDQKEHWFKQKEEFSIKIKSLIGNIRSSKEQRNNLTVSVKHAKDERSKINDQIKAKIDQVKKFNEEKDTIMKKNNIQGNPSRLKEDIDRLEMKIQTDVMSFDKEKEIMKVIKGMKKQYAEFSKVSDVWKKIHELSKEIDQLKRSSDETHKKLQNQASQSQEKHELMIESSKEIDDLRAKELDANEKFLKFKVEFTAVNTALKEKLHDVNQLNGKLGEDKKSQRKEKEDQQKKTLEERQREVNEKLKKGGKLTTEDLLAYQAMDR